MEVRILILLSFSAKDPKRKTLAKELEEEENILKRCVEKLKLVEASRVALVSYTLMFNIFCICSAYIEFSVVPDCVFQLFLHFCIRNLN